MSWAGFTIFSIRLPHAEAHRLLQNIVTEFRELRARETTAAEWNDFHRRADDHLAWMLPKLEQSATSDDPASMQLLFIARDDLPIMLTEESRVAEQKVDQHFRNFDKALVSRNGKPANVDWTMIGIAVFDILLMAVGLWWWSRST